MVNICICALFPVKPCSAHDRSHPGYQSYHLFTSNAGYDHKDHYEQPRLEVSKEPPSPKALSSPSPGNTSASRKIKKCQDQKHLLASGQIVGCILVSHGKVNTDIVHVLIIINILTVLSQTLCRLSGDAEGDLTIFRHFQPEHGIMTGIDRCIHIGIHHSRKTAITDHFRRCLAKGCRIRSDHRIPLRWHHFHRHQIQKVR